MPSQITYERTGLGWQGSKSQPTKQRLDNRPQDRGRLLTKQEQPKFHKKPSIIIKGLYDFEFEEQTLGRTSAHYFPDVPPEEVETFRYPMPLSEEFWRSYSETLLTIMSVASRFRETLLTLSSWKNDRVNPHGSAQAAQTLNALIAGASPAAVLLKDGTIEQSWQAPSLLASLAMMALEDLSGPQRILRCQVCGKLFNTRAYQAAYCSDTCRHTAQKRRYRAKRREETDGQTRLE